MSASRKIAILLFVAIIISVTESKGGGGGGSRGGGSRSGGSRTSSGRTSSSRYSSRLPRAYNARSWTGRTKTVAMNAGSIYIAARLHRLHYRDTSGTYDDSIMKMDICRNVKRFPRYNSTQKVYGWFICPTSGDEEGETYCCGDEDEEYCCSYWNSSGAVRDLVFKCLGVAIVVIAIIYFLCKNPSVFETIIGLLVLVVCCPCHFLSKLCPRRQPHQHQLHVQALRRIDADAEPDADAAIRTADGDETGENIPPPPSYDSCVRRSLISDEIDVSFANENPSKTADGPEGNHCDDLPYSLSPFSHIEPSAPTAPSSTYRPPSPPTYRSPSPPRYRSPSPPHYRSSSPVCGRSSPGRHSVSSNRS